jgi:hypothetical protein
MNTGTLVIGASTNESRYSNQAIRKLRGAKIQTFAIGAKKGKVLDVVIETEQKVYQNVHTVTLYLNPERQKGYYAYILKLQPKRIIFNPGTENDEFMEELKRHGIEVDLACTLVLLATNQYK